MVTGIQGTSGGGPEGSCTRCIAFRTLELVQVASCYEGARGGEAENPVIFVRRRSHYVKMYKIKFVILLKTRIVREQNGKLIELI